MGLVVVAPGIALTVQDRGRTGYRAWGVPEGGAFDRASAALANALLGNDPGCAVLELTWLGGRFEARSALGLALAGAPMAVTVVGSDGRERRLEPPVSFPVAPGARLALAAAPTGARAYLAVVGGWQTDPVLGSRSDEERLRAGDVLPCREGTAAVRRPVWPALVLPGDAPIRVVDGPDAPMPDGFAPDPTQVYRVRPESDRAGLRLEGPAWDLPADPNRVSAPVAPGALQVAGGQLIILGVAAGTMGGYPHVGHVVSADLDRVAQARPGDRLRFARVSIAEARRLDAARREWLRKALARVAAGATDGAGRTPD